MYCLINDIACGEKSLPTEILSRGMFYWLRAPRNSADLHLDEWILASVRLLLSICYLSALIRPGGAISTKSSSVLLISYVAFSLAILLLLRLRTQLSVFSHIAIHLADILLATQLIILIRWPSMSFVLFFFIMACAALRWGFWEAHMTFAAFLIILLIGCYTHNPVLLHQWLSKNSSELLPEALLYIAVSCMVGLLAEAKAVRSEGNFLARIAEGIRIEPGLEQALYAICKECRRLFGAAQILFAACDRETNQSTLFSVARSQDVLQFWELDSTEREKYLFLKRGTSVRLKLQSRSGRVQYKCMTLAAGEIRKSESECDLPDDFLREHRFQLLLASALEFEDAWSVRVYVIDPKPYFGGAAGLRFLEKSIRRVAPVIHDLFLVRRLTANARAAAGSQMARELHDGAIQSLFNLNLQIEEMRRQNGTFSAASADFLSRIQQSIQKEITALRDFMQQLRSLEINAESLLSYLAGLSVKFECENGITTRFIPEVEEVRLRPHVCMQLARIVQEALINIRKHSDAKEALIRLGRRNGNWVISIIDDGIGFGFSGSRSHEELRASGKGPLIIMERALAIDGRVSIESVEGKGSCLEVVFPSEANVKG
jgi:signal transduction histidine kinase